jgi:hypothetical protein
VRTAAAPVPVFLQNNQSFEQPEKPVYRPVVLHSHRQRLPLIDRRNIILYSLHVGKIAVIIAFAA